MKAEFADGRISRRDLIRIGLGSAGAGYILRSNLNAGGLGGFFDRYFPSAPEPQDLTPHAIYDGPIAIFRGAKIRTSPSFPEQTKLSHPSNTIPWEGIRQINNADIKGDVFVINGPKIVKGQPADYADYGSGLEPRRTDWIKLPILTVQGRNIAGYVNMRGSQDFVQELVQTREVSLGEDSYSDLFRYGENNVFLPSSPDRAARDVAPLIWTNFVNGKLDYIVPLRGESRGLGWFDPGEKIIPVSKVIAQGDSEQQRRQMEENGTLINVRNHPGIEYINSEPVEIVGKVAQGTEVRNIYTDFHKWWAGLRRRDILGDLYGESGKPIDVKPDQVVAIWKFYLDF